jgi:tetratricopeptide (TPR) repeat protein
MDAVYGAGSFARLQGDYSRAVAHGEAGLVLARALDDWFHAAQSQYLLGLIAHYQGDMDRARSLYEEALGLSREAHAPHFEAMILNNLGDTDAAQGDLLAAQENYERALSIWRGRADNWGMGIALLNLGNTALRTGNLPRARELFSEGLTMSVELGDQARIADYLNAAGRFAATTGRWESVARLLGTATALYRTAGVEQFPDHQKEHEQAMAAAKANLGDEAFTAARDAGQALLPEQAVAEALSVTFAPVSDTNRPTP